ncbi:MAG: ATP-binding protein [Candidatus Aminicenantes bacterium]|nr:ATP-binding protein [Candidatus Aminicenantes bacterium]
MAEKDKICPRCEGSGWMLISEGGRTIAKRCSCFWEKQIQLLLEKAGIPKRYQNCTFKNFEVHNDSHKDALRISKQFVKNYPIQDVGLLFIGPCGVGKTHLAVAIIRELIEKKGVPCAFYDFRDLIRHIQSTYDPEADLTTSEVLEPVLMTPVVVLDELGAKRTTPWVEETIFYIINYRYNEKKLTIFTTNYLDKREEDKKSEFYKKGEDTLIDRIGVRLHSRIYEMCKIVELWGEDYRKIAKQAGYRF